ncbi:MAG TPA: PA0069 family radical SAM protein [Tepidisphaeraceae bacterium]|nr:PA0069 family radical SAM protein [Tepidisphaeraceae bacterium]
MELPILKGRGAQVNPPNRFESLRIEADAEEIADLVAVQTQYFLDATKQIIAENDSPDVGFAHSVNPYRGCSHGCIYCYARPTHEYLGFSAGLDFESKIMVKKDAADLLRRELSSAKYQPVPLTFSGVTDCYQPIERKLQLTRSCLRVLADFRNPTGIITKSHLITRDIDLLAELARHSAAVALVSITTLNADLAAKMEPRAAAPRFRLDAVRQLAAAKIPVGIMMAPIIPGLTDHEIPAVLAAAAEAGAQYAGYTALRLPFAVKDLFADWLDRHFPDRKEKVLNRIRSLRGGKLNDPNFGSRMRGEGVWADQLRSVFALAKRRARLDNPFPVLSTAAFQKAQLTLW